MPGTSVNSNRQHCIICSDDPEFIENLTGYLSDLLDFWAAETSQEAFTRLERRSHCIVIVDLHLDGALPLITALVRRKPGCITIAIGSPQSSPFREASTKGIFATFDVNAPSSSLQALVEQATHHLEAIAENQALSQQIAELKETSSRFALKTQPIENTNRIALIADILGKLQKPFDVLDDVLDHLSAHFLSTSAGIFTIAGDEYTLRSGLRCSEEAWHARLSNSDAFVRWLKAHGQLISRKSLCHIEQVKSRLALGQVLDTLGAEIVIPITANSSLLGWLFLGAKANNAPYEREDQQTLLRIGDQVAKILGNLIQFNEKSKQQRIFVGLADAVPSGMLLVDSNHTVSWANDEAKRILKIEDSKPGVQQSIDTLHPRVADVARRAWESNGRLIGVECVGANGAHLEITARHLENRGDEIGIMVLIEESPSRFGSQKIQSPVGNSQISGPDISFRIRNALSTIKSFTQLVSERHDDPQFLASLGGLVNSEIDAILELSENLSGSPELHADTHSP